VEKYNRHFFTDQTAIKNINTEIALFQEFLKEHSYIHFMGQTAENDPNLLKNNVSSGEPEREFDRDELYPEMEGNWGE